MIHSEKQGESTRMKEKMEKSALLRSHENGLSHVLSLVLQELSLFYKRDVNGVGVLYDLLKSPWLQALLKKLPTVESKVVALVADSNSIIHVYECLHQHIKKQPPPLTLQGRALAHEVVDLLRGVPQSPDVKELRRLLRGPHFKALLSAHDTVAQKNYEPVLPPLPEHIPENEEAMRIVCLVKNKQPLGATIKRHELTGDITVARVIHGGLADRSGLLYAGDKLVEVNGVPVEGLEPEQVIHILGLSQGTIMFKLIPVSDRPVSNHTTLYVRAMADYWPLQDPAIPCADAGLPFKKGDILQIVDQNDALWWQARKVSDLSACAGLIPSNHLLKRKQREFWWSQPFQPHTCLKSTILSTVEEEDDMQIDEKCVETELLNNRFNKARPPPQGSPSPEPPNTQTQGKQKDNDSVQMKCICYFCSPDDLKDEETFESEEEEFSGSGQQVFITGFRRSMRLCRRKARNSHLPCYARCPGGCFSAVAAPYEEVVRYQRLPGDRNRLIVLVGPSGVGVNELRRRLIGINPHLFQSAVPHTTRPQKSYEVNGREYHYVPKETFENMVYSHRMLEYGEYKGNLYGTSIDAVRAVLDAGKICIVDLEPQSIQLARTHELKPYIIFIKPSSMSCMKQSRKNARMITDYYVNMKFKEEDLQEMEESAQKMETQFGQFFDHIIVNDHLQEACMQLLAAVRRAQDEPQWVPATWICSENQP